MMPTICRPYLVAALVHMSEHARVAKGSTLDETADYQKSSHTNEFFGEFSCSSFASFDSHSTCRTRANRACRRNRRLYNRLTDQGGYLPLSGAGRIRQSLCSCDTDCVILSSLATTRSRLSSIRTPTAVQFGTGVSLLREVLSIQTVTLVCTPSPPMARIPRPALQTASEYATVPKSAWHDGVVRRRPTRRSIPQVVATSAQQARKCYQFPSIDSWRSDRD